MINVSQKILIETNKNEYFFDRQERTFRQSIKYVINKRILIRIFVLYLMFQVIISDNSIITLKIQNTGNNSFIYQDFKEYLSEVYINDENLENIETYYNFTEENNTIKLIFNSQINNCNKMFMDCSNISEIDFSL